MYIYRAINELDEELNPMENGLIAKSIIDQVIHYDFDFLLYATYFRKQEKPFQNMKERDLDEIYHEVRKKFKINMHLNEILKIADKNQQMINDIFKGIINKDVNSINQLIDILSTKNGHITNGSTKDYPWISFSTDLEKIKHYYESQEINTVVVVDSCIDKFYDTCNNDFLLALDLSSDEKIKDNEFIINSNKTGTKQNYRGLNYAKKDKEVIYYNRVPKEKIVTILESLQYELLLNGLLNEEYYQIPEYKKRYWKLIILKSIKDLLKNNGDIVNYVLDEYYTKNNSLKHLAEIGKYSLDELNYANQFILQRIKENTLVKSRILKR